MPSKCDFIKINKERTSPCVKRLACSFPFFFCSECSANEQVCFLFHSGEVCLLLCRELTRTHLASVPVDQVEDGVILRLPGHDLVEALALDSVQHELEQVQLDRLLDENDVVLRHD